MVRITAQLIDIHSTAIISGPDSYDRELQDIFAIRSQVAQTVAKALQVTLGAGERQKLEQKPTEDLEAYQLYSEGTPCGRDVHCRLGITPQGSRICSRRLRATRATLWRYQSAWPTTTGAARTGWLSRGSGVPWPRCAARRRRRRCELDPSLAEAHAHILGGGALVVRPRLRRGATRCNPRSPCSPTTLRNEQIGFVPWWAWARSTRASPCHAGRSS